MYRARVLALPLAALLWASPGAAAAGEGTDVRVGAYGYVLTAEDVEGAELSEQVGVTLKAKTWTEGWHGRVAFEERTSLSGPEPHGRPDETGARLTALEGTTHIAGLDLTAGRFHAPPTLGHMILDGLAVGKGLTDSLDVRVFGGRLPLTADLGHLTKDQGEAFGGGVNWRSGRGSYASLGVVAGRRQAVFTSTDEVSDPQQTKAIAARGGWRVSDMVSLSGGVQAGDRLRLKVRNTSTDQLASATEDAEVVDLDLLTAHVRARLRLSRDLRVLVSAQRLQAMIFNDGAGNEDAFHDVAGRVRWRFWGPATITLRARRRLRQDADSDRLTGYVSLDDALTAGMILNGGVTRDTGDGFDKTRSNAELGWRMDMGPGSVLEAAGTFTWIRRDNSDGGDNGYSAANLTDTDDPVSAFALALAPNDTAGLRASWLSRTLFLTADAARDLGSEQTWAFLHAGWRWR